MKMKREINTDAAAAAGAAASAAAPGFTTVFTVVSRDAAAEAAAPAAAASVLISCFIFIFYFGFSFDLILIFALFLQTPVFMAADGSWGPVFPRAILWCNGYFFWSYRHTSSPPHTCSSLK